MSDDDKIVRLHNTTTLPIPVERVLDGARSNLNPDGCMLVIGWDKDGAFYIACNVAEPMELLWLVEAARNEIMDGTRS